MVRLSHSAMEKYKTCPKMYELHYKEKLRGKTLSSPLLFGGAIDESLNRLLLTKKKDTTADEKIEMTQDPYQAFDYYFSQTIINGETEDMPTSLLLEYYASDFDADLLEEEDFLRLKMYIKNAGYLEDDGSVPESLALFEEIRKTYKENPIESVDLAYINLGYWLSLRRKGHMMIDVYRDKIMPMIEEVISIQREVVLPNDAGDTLIGFIDFEAKFHGKEGIYTVDNKTSSRKYKASDINDKGQLVIYDEFTGNGKGAYVVLLKKLKKTKVKTCQDCRYVTEGREKTCKNMIAATRCKGEFSVEVRRELEFQVLGKEIEDERKELLFEEINDILEDVKGGIFLENRNNCLQFGRKCVYWDYCREGNVDNLSRGK